MDEEWSGGRMGYAARPGLIFRASKRTIDVIMSMVALVLLLPVMVCIAALIKTSSRGSVFFRQERIGRFGTPFLIYKFRTMIVDADKMARETAGRSDPRITPLGAFLRKTKLDELPQFINVLVGDMSMVGPRPEIPFYAQRYAGEERDVFCVRPGITDACSIELADLDDRMDQRGDLSPAEYYERFIFPRKKELQLRYVRNLSLAHDLLAVLSTARRVLLRCLWR